MPNPIRTARSLQIGSCGLNPYCLPPRELGLLKAVASCTGLPFEALYTVALEVLGQLERIDPPGRYSSRLNNDGSPLQVCLSCSPDGLATRVIGDPASDLQDPGIRHQAALGALEALLEARSLTGLARLARVTLVINLPPEISAEPALAYGTLWLGASVEGSGIAVYIKGNWGETVGQWQRVWSWLERVAPPCPALSGLLARLSACAEVASVGLEGLDPRRVRYKVYFRLNAPVKIEELGIELLSDRRFALFLSAALGTKSIARSGLLFCIGVTPQDGLVGDAKIDLCGHCLEGSVSDWDAYMRDVGEAVGIPAVEAGSLGVNRSTRVAFLGFGLTDRGAARLNVYLKGDHER